jgi:hypothetical protein
MSEPVPPSDLETREAERIYHALFGARISDAVRDRFVRASRRLESATDPTEVARYRRALERVNDLEALEIACRYRRTLPLLSRKFRIMVAMAETVPETQSHFVNETSSLLRGITTLVAGGFRSAYKLGKGILLQQRLGPA